MYLWLAQILALWILHNEHVGRLHQLFLHARGRHEDVVAMSDAGSAASAGDLSKNYAQYLVKALFG